MARMIGGVPVQKRGNILRLLKTSRQLEQEMHSRVREDGNLGNWKPSWPNSTTDVPRGILNLVKVTENTMIS